MDLRTWPAFAWERLGLAAAVLALLAVLAGAPLALRYVATPDGAHASVAAMQPWLRGAHAWAASLALVALLLDMARCWLSGPAPRDWYARALGLALLLGGQLTGGILAWDQQGWESLQHLAGGAGLSAGEPGSAPLGSLFAAHLALGLGLVAAFVLGLPQDRTGLARDAARLAAPLALALALLALLAPPALGPAPIAGIAMSKPDWPFLWLTPLQDLLGTAGLLLGTGTLAAMLLAAPWLAQRWGDAARRRALLAAAAVLLALSAWGALS